MTIYKDKIFYNGTEINGSTICILRTISSGGPRGIVSNLINQMDWPNEEIKFTSLPYGLDT